MGTNLKTQFNSHPGKLLHDHLNGVATKVERRTSQKAAKIAAIFHDLGKINQNFQDKLQGKQVGYSSHAYLSAIAWLCFCRGNRSIIKTLIGDDPLMVFSVAAMIARHHGNLPDMDKGIFKELPGKLLRDFLKTTPYLPISDFLQGLIEHQSFTVFQSDAVIDQLLTTSLQEKFLSAPLNFFLETQFGFACLIESDKRDAGDNNIFNREEIGQYFKNQLAIQLDKKLNGFTERSSLDQLRTKIRNDAVKNIQPRLIAGERIFTLSAPTGAGKTMMLLSLAKEIFAQDKNLNIIYALPFLSITEQVEKICKEIYCDNADAILRIDSKSTNERIDNLQKALDMDPSKENLQQLLRESFSEATFDHPFIITTFIQLFETLVSNHNSTLLKLTNFSRAIFLIDEIQALPPNLYTFFTALLSEFCYRFNSYAIISTATMPYLIIPDKNLIKYDAKKLFINYQPPNELLSTFNYYRCPEFNRYQINPINQKQYYLDNLFEDIVNQEDSCLVILNTIDDTKNLYNKFEHFSSDTKYILLNTHFTTNDRQHKIALCNQLLKEKKRVVLIATQLIEAGVDIDFPILYRDLCPLPNLIQSAGRCNRNGKNPFGQVYLFELKRDNGVASASLIYRDKTNLFLQFTRNYITKAISEIELFDIQRTFFEFVGTNLQIGLHQQFDAEMDLVKCIYRAEFEQLGRFNLIDKKSFGNEYRYYISPDKDDYLFEEFTDLFQQQSNFRKSFEEAKRDSLALETLLRKMSGNIVNFRLSPDKEHLAPSFTGDEIMGIRKLSNRSGYSYHTGIRLDESISCII